jgi:hypothetical protein
VKARNHSPNGLNRGNQEIVRKPPLAGIKTPSGSAISYLHSSVVCYA